MAEGLRDYQEKALDMLYQWLRTHETGNPCLVLPTGCHAKGQGILMADGSIRRVEDIIAGDKVMGGDGTSRTVLELHRGHDEMFRIVPVKGKPFIVNSGHVLSMISTSEGKSYPSNCTGQEIVNLTVAEYMDKSKYFKHLHKLYRGKVASFGRDQQSLPLPPYILGIMLGDGCMSQGGFIITNPEPEIQHEFVDYLKTIECVARISFNSTSDCPTLAARASGKKFSKNAASYSKITKQLGLYKISCKCKFIPDCYRYGSLSCRLEVLAGLLDTDGSLGNNCFDYISASRKLAEDVEFLARSLGFAAYLSECEKNCQTKRNGRYWRVSISGDLQGIPTRVARKKASARSQKKRVNVTGFEIEPVGQGDYFGFSIDGDHLYMLDDFTVTHNSGKSHIIAAFCKREMERWPGMRILMLTHQKELIEQDAQKLLLSWPLAPVGIYSASLKSKQIDRITFASIQSIARHPELLGHVNAVLIDEAHLVNHEDQGTYRKFLDELKPDVVIGFTATPYRLGHGLITDKPALFDSLIEPVTIKDLIDQGFLAKLVSKGTSTRLSVEGVGKRGGDYIESQLHAAVDVPATSEAVVEETMRRGADRRHWLFFCSGIEHAQHVCDILNSRGIAAACVTGKTPRKERERLLSEYKAGRIKAVTNANLLCIGFDFPGIDLIAMMRPTLSPGLYMQMAGRGLRISPDKKDCLVLDFAGNVAKHGPITEVRPPSKKGKGEGVAPSKICPICDEIVPAQCRTCPSCGHSFQLTEKEEFYLRYESIMGDEDSIMPVRSWFWNIHYKRDTEEPMLKVTYLGRPCDDPIAEYLKIWCLKYFQWQNAWNRFTAIASKAGVFQYPQKPDDLLKVMNRARCPLAVVYRKKNGYAQVSDHVWADEENRRII